MALLPLGIVLSIACFYAASFIKRTQHPSPGSRQYVAMRAAYFLGWAGAVLAVLLLLILLFTTLNPPR